MSYQYTYLLMAIGFLAVWIVLYAFHKNSRREMLWMSLYGALAGPSAELLYTIDWWRPLTITKTLVGVEDFLFGMAVAGIGATAYEYLFKRHLMLPKQSHTEIMREQKHVLIFIVAGLALLFGSHYLLGFNTLHATITTLFAITAVIWYQRRDLVRISVVTGIILFLVAFAVYNLLALLTPGWIDAFWYWQNVPEIIILNMPLDDMIWYFMAGALFGPMYAYLRGAHFVKDGKPKSYSEPSFSRRMPGR
jgi:hypothetical protein